MSEYQFSCKGRHKQTYIFSGNIVPILNKILASGDSSSGLESEAGPFNITFERGSRPFNIVRVEASEMPAKLNADVVDSECNVMNALDMTRPDVEGKKEDLLVIIQGCKDTGQGVARKMLGGNVFRGKITKVSVTSRHFLTFNYHRVSTLLHDTSITRFPYTFQYKDNERRDSGPNGTYYVHFSDGKKLKMDAEQVYHARKLFEREVHKLVACGMTSVDAKSPMNVFTAASLTRNKVRQPILAEEKDEDPKQIERIFEEVFDGELPNAIVGLEFAAKEVYLNVGMNKVELWEKVLM